VIIDLGPHSRQQFAATVSTAGATGRVAFFTDARLGLALAIARFAAAFPRATFESFEMQVEAADRRRCVGVGSRTGQQKRRRSGSIRRSP
jgi:hypothetical protein